MRRLMPGLLVILLMILALAIAGCADDLYGQCTIDTDDRLLSECANSDSASCIVEEQLECQTRICGKYRGSTPFCTVECTSDGDCPSGECREFVFQSGRNHCVADVDIQ